MTVLHPDTIKGLQVESAAESDGLLSVKLERAFKGEL